LLDARYAVLGTLAVNRTTRYGQPRRGRAACHGRAKQQRAAPGREPRRTGPPRAAAQACCEQAVQSRREQPCCALRAAPGEPRQGRAPRRGRHGRAPSGDGMGRCAGRREGRPCRGLGHAVRGCHGHASRALAAHRRHACRAPGRGPRGRDGRERASRGGAARRAPAPGPTASGGGGGGRPPRRGTPGSRRTPWPSFGRAEPRHPAAREGGREGRDEGGEGGEAYHETGVERTDAAATVLGDESDGERRKKRHGEEDEQGAIPRLTGGPHMQRRRLPSRLPHRPGERTAPTRWRLGRAELGHRGSGLRREGERGEKQAAGRETVAGPQTPGRPTTRKGGGGKGRPRLGCAREAGPRERGGGFGVFLIYFPVLALIHH
jgi:hypothetical protein